MRHRCQPADQVLQLRPLERLAAKAARQLGQVLAPRLIAAGVGGEGLRRNLELARDEPDQRQRRRLADGERTARKAEVAER